MHHEFTRAFVGAWEEHYPSEKYPFAGGKDGESVKWMRGQVGDDLEKFRVIVARYLADDSDFYRGHPLSKLRIDFAKFLVASRPKSRGGFRTQDDRTMDMLHDAAEAS